MCLKHKRFEDPTLEPLKPGKLLFITRYERFRQLKKWQVRSNKVTKRCNYAHTFAKPCDKDKYQNWSLQLPA